MLLAAKLITERFPLSVTVVLATLVAILGLLYLWIQHKFLYWKRFNIPHIKPNPIFGNFKDLIIFKKDPCDFFQGLYNHKDAVGQPVVGLHVFHKPCLLIRELELVKAILIKDFNSFADRFSSSDPHSDPLGSDNLFFVKNPKWKEIRVKISPVFTSGKMKQMYPLIEEIGRELDRHLCNLPIDPKTNAHMLEVKELSALFATDVIATSAYGIKANSLANPTSEFRENGKRIFHFTLRRAMEFTSMFFMPQIVPYFRFKLFSKESTNFLRDTLNYVMDERIKSKATRNDLIDVLINFRQQAEAQKDNKSFVINGDCLVAQAALFFSAGFETSSMTMSFGLYELSRHLELQKRLREEIRDAIIKHNGKITYEMVHEMKFLNNVIKEVLRLYPPLSFLDRECTPQDEGGYSLQPYCDFVIPKGMPVYIPMQSLHMDPQYFPNPEEFNPDRFAPENRDNINLNAYMPFGIGPHNCIGERFGQLQSRIGLINFLRNHYVTPCEKSQKTMKLDPRAIIIQAEGGVYLNIVRDPLI